MTLFQRLRIPSLGGVTEWLGVEPLGPCPGYVSHPRA